MAKIGLISLGCPKNVVDAEEILGEVSKAGHRIETDPEQAEVLIVNTCGFIKSAKEESIEAILEAVRCKTEGACKSVIVTGCLSQRYGAELAKEIPEADCFIGLGASGEIVDAIERTLSGERSVRIAKPGDWWLEGRSRVLTTRPWTAYLRIADGCDNRCTYCAIPDIRGGFRSRSEGSILAEAKKLAETGVKELNLVAQDVTRYGLDKEGALALPRILDKISEIDGIEWIRLLYCYPTRITDDLIRVIAGNEKVCKYVDVPLQHCSDRILSAMGRGGSKQEYIETFDRLREKCPDAALRTTFIVGFPGETEADVEELLEFVERVEFDRVGVFAYSPEDGTPASLLKGTVKSSTAKKRLNRVMELQQSISLGKNKGLVGKRMQILVEDADGAGSVGRSYRDAPEIDGLVYLDRSVVPGRFVIAEITGARHYDLVGRIVREDCTDC
jgi:ribosomal protein S12 methylthiotransferase